MNYDKIIDETLNECANMLYNVSYDKLSYADQGKVFDYVHDKLYPIWKNIIINDIDTGYKINKIGIVKDPKGNIVKKYLSTSGYQVVWIHIAKQKNNYPKMVHRLVAELFIPNPENKPEVNHLDSNKENNWVGNLEWVTHQENIDYAIKNGHQIIGMNHKNSKFSDEQINAACKLLEDPSISLADIVRKTGVSIRTLKHIKNGNGWKHISRNYNICYGKRSQGPKFSELSENIFSLVKSGKSNDEIYKIIRSIDKYSGISMKSIADRIYHIRKMIE